MSFFTKKINGIFSILKHGEYVRSFSATRNTLNNTVYEDTVSTQQPTRNGTNDIYPFHNISHNQTAKAGNFSSLLAAANEDNVETIVIDSDESDSDAIEVNQTEYGNILYNSEAPVDGVGDGKNPNTYKRRITVREYFMYVNGILLPQVAFEKLSEIERSCQLCNKSFRRVFGLCMHVDFHCPVQKKYKIRCKICNVVCSNPLVLRRHLMTTHGMNATKVKSVVDRTFLTPILNSKPKNISLIPISTVKSPHENQPGKLINNESISTYLAVRDERLTPAHFPNKRAKICKNNGRTLYNVWENKVAVSSGGQCSSREPKKKNVKLMITDGDGSDSGTVGNYISEDSSVLEWKKSNVSRCSSALPSKNDLAKETFNMCKRKMTVREYYSYRKLHPPLKTLFKQLSGTAISCNSCGSTIAHTSSSLLLCRHLDFHCPVLKKYRVECKLCGKSISNPFALRGHFLLIHDVKRDPGLKDIVDSSFVIPVEKSHSKRTSHTEVTVIKKQKTAIPHSYNSFSLSDGIKLNPRTTANKDKPTVSHNTNLKRCNFCKSLFSNYTSLQTHVDFSCPFQKRFEMLCKLCGKKFTSVGAVRYHIIHKHGSKNYSKIEKRVPILKAFNKTAADTNSSHDIDFVIANENCSTKRLTESNSTKNEEYRSFPRKYNPAANVSVNRFECKHCIKSFRENRFLQTHIRFGHRNIYSSDKIANRKTILAKCELCDNNFYFPSQLQIHVNSQHKKIKIMCQSCKQSFNNFAVFKNHLRKSGHRFICGALDKQNNEIDICDDSSGISIEKKTVSDRAENSHLACNVCFRNCASAFELVGHLQSHLLSANVV